MIVKQIDYKARWWEDLFVESLELRSFMLEKSEKFFAKFEK